MNMIEEARIAKMFDGFQALSEFDKLSIANFISSLSMAVLRMENLAELDINPIIANESGINESGINPIDEVGRKMTAAMH
ncbi:hypothetical protein A4R29_05065 [Mesorhizobium ciceri biovar biserrulae]|nr:hypothetical protein A4R29_05065 [Mesorhizobium ciceri biovar biserrulae]